MYLRSGLVSCDRFVNASLPNMASVASGTTSSHSLCLEICFARQLLRNLWNPSILPLNCGLYGDEYIYLSTPNSFATLENKSFLNLVPLSISSFLQTPNRKAI